MERPVDTPSGPDKAAFEIVRVKPGEMPEGRIQMLRHVTEHTVWQPRWLDHPNTVWGLSDVCIVVADLDEAAARFARFTSRKAVPDADGERSIVLDRGRVSLVTSAAWRRRWPDMPVPDLPFIGECTLAIRSFASARAAIDRDAARLVREEQGKSFSVAFSDTLGVGIWTFQAAAPPRTA
jgi:hypothetical protein